MAAALDANEGTEPAYRRLGATVIDGTRRPDEVADAILAWGASRPRAGSRNPVLGGLR